MSEPLPTHAEIDALEGWAIAPAGPQVAAVSLKVPETAKAPAKETPKKRRPGRHVIQTRDEATNIRLPVVSSMAAATNICHVPFDLMRLAKQKGCAAFDASSRVDIDALLLWIFKNGVVVFPEDASAEISSLSFAQRDKRAVALTREYNLKKLEGSLIDRAAVTSGIGRGTAILFGELEKSIQTLPPSLKGLTESEIQQRLTQLVDVYKQSVRLSLSEITNQNKLCPTPPILSPATPTAQPKSPAPTP